jgi:DNA repair exonuclease SbcCD ATPase subunit
MNITIKKFRCWDNLSLTVPLGQITLIKGCSGSGKTTILQAISWCLYGSVRLVHPTKDPKAKTYVKVILPNMTIERFKHPNRLIVNYRNDRYEDKVAQSMIDELYGVHDIWHASCCINQKSANSFLSASNVSKMDLLHSIAFHEEDPQQFISKIEAAVLEVQSTYNHRLKLFNEKLSHLTISLNQTDMSKALSLEALTLLNTEINQLVELETELTKEYKNRTVSLEIIDNLQKQRDAIVYPEFLEPNTDLGSLDEYTSLLPLLQSRDKLKTEIKQLNAQIRPIVEYTMDDYQRALEDELRYREGERLAKSLQVDYSDEAIQVKINELKHVLDSQDQLKLEKEYQEIMNRIQNLTRVDDQSLPIPELNKIDIQSPDYSVYDCSMLQQQLLTLYQEQGSLTAQIQSLNISKKAIQCPKCSTYLISNNGQLSVHSNVHSCHSNITDELQKTEHLLLSKNNKIKETNNLILDLQRREQLCKQKHEAELNAENRRITDLQNKIRLIELENSKRSVSREHRLQELDKLCERQKQLETLGVGYLHGQIKILSACELEETRNTISRLQNITIIQKPVSSVLIKSHLENAERIQQRDLLSLELTRVLNTIPEAYHKTSLVEVNHWIDLIKDYQSKQEKIRLERERLRQLFDTLDEQIKRLQEKLPEDKQQEIERITHDLTGKRELLGLANQANAVLREHQALTVEREELAKINKELSDLSVLKSLAIETECLVLQQVVHNVNESIRSVCESLFNQEIIVNMQLFRENKGNKVVKPMVNFDITYKGNLYDSIYQMSGGEYDRLSFAMTLSLNMLSACPLLMLDESFESVGIDMKEAAIQTIRDVYGTSKMNAVLIATHDGVEGMYDHVIDVTDLSDVDMA